MSINAKRAQLFDWLLKLEYDEFNNWYSALVMTRADRAEILLNNASASQLAGMVEEMDAQESEQTQSQMEADQNTAYLRSR